MDVDKPAEIPTTSEPSTRPVVSMDEALDPPVASRASSTSMAELAAPARLSPVILSRVSNPPTPMSPATSTATAVPQDIRVGSSSSAPGPIIPAPSDPETKPMEAMREIRPLTGSSPETSPTPPPKTSGSGGAGGSAAARPLNVTDALSYLDAVKAQFQDQPDVYNRFLDIMKDFKSELLDTPGVIQRVSMLFQGNPFLIQGFNTFLPPGYRIDCSADPRDTNITVTTPEGVVTQSTQAHLMQPHPPVPLHPSMQSFDPLIPRGIGRDQLTPGLPPHHSQQPLQPPPQLFPPGYGGSLHPSLTASRPTTPSLAYHLASGTPFVHTPLYSPGLAGPNSTTAAASYLGAYARQEQSKEEQARQFQCAIQYLNKIKERFSDDHDVYKQFLGILQSQQKAGASAKDPQDVQQTQVYAQVNMLFKEAPDLFEEFKYFLPEIQSQVSHLLPQSGGENEKVKDASKGGEKKTAAKRRKRPAPAEKEQTPVSGKGGSRVSEFGLNMQCVAGRLTI
ncbi:PAH2 domain-containing protein, partial [Neolentinus lepideus HHB14362 ss-1]